ncbi:LysR family transcriptional regulator [Paludibacterium yongneupense]|uniref:LysR family transcriptional regulator n=1 Tax=Paludibacterium yongneupense TaxID=400061 RepID=UPI00042591C7|nr:LysR family transcriptional regulator [Paludibacterium yongneupense]
MDLRVLRYFSEIIACGSYASAAERVHVTQPALSKAIRLLEEDLGVPLLERGRRGTGVRPTSEGIVVLRHAQQMLEGRERMVAELKALRGLQRGELRLGMPSLGSAEIFAPVIARYRERYPLVDLHLMERGGEELERAVISGQLELAATILPLRESMEMAFVRDDPMVVALPRAHALATRRSLLLTELASTPLVLYEGGFVLNRLIQDACTTAGFQPQVVARVGQPSFGLALVAAGAGAMLLPQVVAAHHAVEGVAMVPLNSAELRWRLVLVWRKGAILSFAARAFLDDLDIEIKPPPPAERNAVEKPSPGTPR